MKKRQIFVAAMFGVALMSIGTGAAYADSTLTVTARNDTTNIVNAGPRLGASCFGNLQPSSAQIPPGQTQTFTVRVPDGFSQSCGIRLQRDDNLRNCQFQLARIYTAGSWNYPTIYVEQSPSGVTCNSAVTGLGQPPTEGDWSASIGIAP